LAVLQAGGSRKITIGHAGCGVYSCIWLKDQMLVTYSYKAGPLAGRETFASWIDARTVCTYCWCAFKERVPGQTILGRELERVGFAYELKH